MNKGTNKVIASVWGTLALLAIASAMIASTGPNNSPNRPSGTTGTMPDCAGDTTGGS